jgi:hypothetical protein
VDWPIAIACALGQLPLAASPLHPLSAVRDAAIAGDQALFSWMLATKTRSGSATSQGGSV